MEELQGPRGKGMKQIAKRVEEGRGQEEAGGAGDEVRSQDYFKTLDFWIPHS